MTFSVGLLHYNVSIALLFAPGLAVAHDCSSLIGDADRFVRCMKEEASHASVPVAPARPRFEVSKLRSAGDGAPTTGAEPSERPEPSAPPPANDRSVFIQTNEPWTVFLDEHGNPSTVIVGPRSPW